LDGEKATQTAPFRTRLRKGYFIGLLWRGDEASLIRQLFALKESEATGKGGTFQGGGIRGELWRREKSELGGQLGEKKVQSQQPGGGEEGGTPWGMEH